MEIPSVAHCPGKIATNLTSVHAHANNPHRPANSLNRNRSLSPNSRAHALSPRGRQANLEFNGNVNRGRSREADQKVVAAPKLELPEIEVPYRSHLLPLAELGQASGGEWNEDLLSEETA
jgi:hypothetical protein